MKLADLNPEFVDAGGPGVPARRGIGLILDCPCGTCGEDRRLWVPFANPLDGGPKWHEDNERCAWTRVGDSFETLTLTPSIQRLEGCQWHGFITNGEVRTV